MGKGKTSVITPLLVFAIQFIINKIKCQELGKKSQNKLSYSVKVRNFLVYIFVRSKRTE